MNDTYVVTGAPPVQKSVIVEGGKPVGYEQLAVSSTAVSLTVPLRANTATLVIETDSVRYRDDGTDPTASVGMLLYPGQSIQIQSKDMLNAVKFIRVTSDAVVNVSYYERS